MNSRPDIRPAILCGGNGARLWPVSTPSFPKPFLGIGHGPCFLAQSVSRLRPFGRPVIVTRTDLAARCAGIAAGRADILVEPAAQGTGMAVARFVRTQPDDGSICVITNADWFIRNTCAYERALTAAVTMAKDTDIVVIGVSPDHPATGFGYMMPDASDGAVLEKFVEKPRRAQARALMAQGALWNTGHVVARAGVLGKLLAEFAPDMWAVSLTGADDAAVYPSFDRAVLEKAGRIGLVRGEFDWIDIGTFPALLRAYGRSFFR